MKKFVLFGILVLGSLSLTVSSCSQENNEQENKSTIITANQLETKTLSEKTLLADNIYLPIGTKWHYINKNKSEVVFDLPEGYLFLIKENSTGNYITAPGGGGYSCTCSASGSSTVFNNKKVGCGCLHSSCTGSCTGTPTSSKGEAILGVLIAANDQIDAVNDYLPASLSKEGKKAFFELPKVQLQIKKHYDFIYENYEDPNFNSLNSSKDFENSNYHLVQVSLYGFGFALVFPNDPTLAKYFPELANKTKPTSCSCSGGGSGCDFEKDCLFGKCVYYCTGCTTCTMS